MSIDQTSSPDQTDAVRDRRSVLRGAAVVGMAGVAAPLLAACGDDGDTAGGGATSTAPSEPPPSSAPSSEPSGESSSAPGGGGGAELGPASDVPVGGGKVYPDAKIVVTQPTAGQYKGFTAVCTHQQCIVKDVAGGTINCGCHGSKYGIADGSVKNGPAPDPLASAKVTVEGGKIMGPAS